MRRLLLIVMILVTSLGIAQDSVIDKKLLDIASKYQAALTAENEPNCFDVGEKFKFKVSFSGFLKAGYATLELKDDTYQGKPVYHAKGFGTTTGLAKVFYKVEDFYESYFDKQSILPYHFIRKIDEGGYTKDVTVDFDQEIHKAFVHDHKHKKEKKFKTDVNVQDLVSCFYYLRKNYEIGEIQVGEEVSLNMFFDEENFDFKLRYLGDDEIKTKFGKVKSMKFRPLVMSGRVFKEQESLTVWISKDENKVPLRIKADLVVGSLRADLSEYSGLKSEFEALVE